MTGNLVSTPATSTIFKTHRTRLNRSRSDGLTVRPTFVGGYDFAVLVDGERWIDEGPGDLVIS